MKYQIKIINIISEDEKAITVNKILIKFLLASKNTKKL